MATVLFIGPKGSGKSALCHRLATGNFLQAVKPSLGIQFYKRSVSGLNADKVDFLFWEFQGCKSQLHTLLKDADIIVCVYSAAKPNSFSELKQEFLDDQSINPPYNLHKKPYVIVGTHYERDEVNIDETVDAECNRQRIPHFKVSAKTALGIDGLWSSLKSVMINLTKLRVLKRQALARTTLITTKTRQTELLDKAKQECAHLWDNDLTPMLNVRKLLNDYAQQNVTWRLWVGFHFSRNHTDVVAQLVEQIDLGKFDMIQDLFSALRAIPNRNRFGALNLRIEYIKHKLSDLLVNQEAADNILDEENSSSWCCGIC